MSISRRIKQLLYAINQKNDVKYTVIYTLKIDGKNERYTREIDVMNRLMEIYKTG